MEASAGDRRRLAARRQPGLALGPGPAAAAAVASARRYGVDAGLVTAVDLVRGPRRAHRHARSSRSRARPAGTTPTTRASGTPRSPALADGRRPVRHPRRGHRRGRPRRRPRREGARARALGRAASSPTWSTASTPWGRGGCCCCPTTPRRCALKTHTTDSGAVPAGRLGDRRPGRRLHRAGDRRLRAGARPRADGPSSRPATVRG